MSVLAIWLALAACNRDQPPVPVLESVDGVGVVGVRRLSRDEYDNTLRDLVLDDTRPGSLILPEDVIDPFDNDYTTQLPSAVLVGALESLANDVGSRLVADETRRAEVVGCEPADASDEACMREFVERFGRRALRRPLEPDEVDRLVEAGLGEAAAVGDFWGGVDLVVRVLLQHPRFVYRVEIGAPTLTPGVFRLDDHEVATRLSYFLWGTTPDDALLDLADAGQLSTSAGVRSAAGDMLDDPRARDRIDRFHAMWLGYWLLAHDPALADRMRAETRQLLDEVWYYGQEPWAGIFTMPGTWIDDTLAAHYGLPAPGSGEPVWVDYGDSGRKGLLSHGTFLSVASKFDDTSPTQRGKLIRERLLCQVIPPPPPDVNVDEPPTSTTSDCKWDAYAQHRESGACQSCHEQMDPVGFGLENYDEAGRYRAHDDGAPDCVITGEGDIDGELFTGPAGLADLLVTGELLETCMVAQVYRFAMGHEPSEDDEALLNRLLTSFPTNDGRLDQLVLTLVSDEAFLYRREEE